jgi:hypothetical protein
MKKAHAATKAARKPDGAKARPQPRIKPLVLLVAALALLESALILAGAIKPVLSYSPENLFFAFARIGLVAYAGVVSAREGLRRAALNGAIASFAGVAVICLAALAGRFWLKAAVLGVAVPDTASMVVLLAFIIIENTAIGAVVAAAAALVATKAHWKQ